MVADRDAAAARRGRRPVGSTDIAVSVTVDVTDYGRVSSPLLCEAVLAFGGVDLVVNDAAVDLEISAHGDDQRRLGSADAVMRRAASSCHARRREIMRARRWAATSCTSSKNAVFAGPNTSSTERRRPTRSTRSDCGGRTRRARHPGQRHQPGPHREREPHLRRRLGSERAAVYGVKERSWERLCPAHVLKEQVLPEHVAARGSPLIAGELSPHDGTEHAGGRRRRDRVPAVTGAPVGRVLGGDRRNRRSGRRDAARASCWPPRWRRPVVTLTLPVRLCYVV